MTTEPTTPVDPKGPLELIPLATFTAELRAPLVLDGTPAGGRWIFEVASGTITGDRIQATVTGSANADWLVLGPDGVGTLDVRVVVETHDGALIFIQYNGRVDLSAGGGAPVYAAPRFDTGDERYAWLNKIQAAGKGSFEGSTLVYQIYELR